jgi:hypothetical protein
MRNLMTTAIAAVAAVALVATAAPADASALSSGRLGASCKESLDPQQTHNDYTVYSVGLMGTNGVELRTGLYTDGSQVSWTRILGPQGTRAWMDISQDHGNSWYQCGPTTFEVTDGVGFHFMTRANRNNASRSVRACGDDEGYYNCTGWW